MRFHLLTPLVLVGTACEPSFQVPVNWEADNTPVLPPMTPLVLPTRADATAAWQLPADDPWLPYAKPTLFAALEETHQYALLPDVQGMPSVRAATVAAGHVAAAGLPADTLWMVDLHGASSVAFGVALSQVTQVSLVPTFNNWPAQNELVPAEETLSALVQLHPTQPDPLRGPSIPVFLLDSWRMAFPEVATDDTVVDNRYALTAADLPSAEVLIARGIRRVAYVVDDHTERPNEEDDLNVVFTAYQEAGIAVDVIDLGDLLGTAPQVTMSWYLDLHLHRVLRRVTRLEDPRFYARAHGGFGGMYARPATYAYATNYSGGHGYGGG